jgi:hypothetical protein
MLGGHIYTQGCKKITEDEEFPMTPASTDAFVKVVENPCTVMGWKQGAHGIPKLQNATGIDIDIVK